MQTSEAVDKAFKQHEPSEGAVMSKTAAMVMLDHAMNELNKAECRSAVPMKVAEDVAHKLEAKLAAYGVTKITLFDSNNDGKFDKNDEVVLGSKEKVKGRLWDSQETVEKVLRYNPQTHEHKQEANFNPDQKAAMQALKDGNFATWFQNRTGDMTSPAQQERFVADVMKALTVTGHKVTESHSRSTGIVDMKVDGTQYTTTIGY